MDFTKYEDVIVYDRKYENFKHCVSGDFGWRRYDFGELVEDMFRDGDYEKIVMDDLVYIGVPDWYTVRHPHWHGHADRENFIDDMLYYNYTKAEIKNGLIWLTPMTDDEIEIFESEED